MDKMINPFDIKSSPEYFAMLEFLENSNQIKTIEPVVFNAATIPTVFVANTLYIGNFKAAVIADGAEMKINFFDETNTQNFSIVTDETLALNFSHNVALDYIGFSYITSVNSLYQYFVGYKITW